MKTSELIGPALDWAVAKCEGYNCEFDDEVSGSWLVPQDGYLHDEKPLSKFAPSIDWSQGGPIIEREGISVRRVKDMTWRADYSSMVLKPDGSAYAYLANSGPRPLIAAMRCYVASKLGDEVDVPEELR